MEALIVVLFAFVVFPFLVGFIARKIELATGIGGGEGWTEKSDFKPRDITSHLD